MDGKIVLLMIAVVAVGMFALPSTLALYSGQHEFVDGANVSCDKCHASASVTWSGGPGNELVNGTAHEALGCQDCHNAANTTKVQGTDYHAATAMGVTCTGCHSTGTGAGVLAKNVSQELLNGSEVHNTMGAGTDGQEYACIACHTGVTVNGTIVSTNGTATNVTLNNTGSW